jgi:hypothetical protein
MSGRSHREGPGERAHRQVGELLPWYVNGTLGPREREKVEDHLAGCPACQAEERACRRMAGAALAAAEVSPSPHPAQLGRLLDRIEVEESARGGRLTALRAQLGAAPRPLRVALLAQAAVIVLLAGLGAWKMRAPMPPMPPTAAPGAGSPAAYRTLSDPAAPAAGSPRAAGGARLRLMFSPGATEREIRALLLGVHGEIVAGPSPMGAYTVEVPARGEPAGAVLARLRSEASVVFAEPEAGGP